MLSVSIGKLKLKNPVMVASGTFGYGEEFADFMNLKALGAIVTKTITLNPRIGNSMPRTCETPAGMLNSIGLENPGIEGFIKNKLAYLKKIGVPIIVSIASEKDPEEFIILARKLDKIRQINALELNISCPNIKLASPSTSSFDKLRTRPEHSRRPSLGMVRGMVSLSNHYPVNRLSGLTGKLIAQDPQATYDLVRSVRKVTGKTLITKLSPNVTDITEIALAAEKAGSDALSLINTLSGMAIDVETKRPRIAAVTAGLSGPAIRPVAIRMVWQVYNKITIPLIGMGGIIDTASALEFILAGSTAVSVGTANFINPKATVEIIRGLTQYLKKNKIRSIQDIIGALEI